MVERGVETEEGNVMMGKAGAEIEVKKKGKAFEVEKGTGEEIETGIMMTALEIMGETETEVDTVIKDGSNSFFCVSTTFSRIGFFAFCVRRIAKFLSENHIFSGHAILYLSSLLEMISSYLPVKHPIMKI